MRVWRSTSSPIRRTSAVRFCDKPDWSPALSRRSFNKGQNVIHEKQMPLTIPDYQEFLTPEELHESSVQLVEEFPHLAQLREIGTSTEGRSIELLTIGSGPKAALF